MSLRTTFLSLLLLLSSVGAAFATPAIQNGSFSSGTTGWTTFPGGNLASTPSLISGSSNVGFVTGSSSGGINRTTLRSELGIADTNFLSNYGNSRLFGAYQTFTTVAVGTVSLNAEFYANASNVVADPFVFLYNVDTGDYLTYRGTGNSAGDVANSLVGTTISGTLRGSSQPGGTPGAPYTHSFRDQSFAVDNLAVGNYIFGFGVGVGNPSSNQVAFAVTNIQSPPVPEIDASSAAIPMALGLLCLMAVSDRRRTSLVKA